MRDKINQLIVYNFKSYTSFCWKDGILYGSSLSYLDGKSYRQIVFKLKKVKDNRKVKLATEKVNNHENNLDGRIELMGSMSRKIWEKRIELTNSISNAQDQISLDSSHPDPFGVQLVSSI